DAFVAQDVFGAYASTYWQAAFGPQLRKVHWTWPSPVHAEGTRRVPSVIGLQPAEASDQLRRAGFAMTTFPGSCGSWLPAGTVAYQQPATASLGAAVTVCRSSGKGYSISGVPGKYSKPPPFLRDPRIRRDVRYPTPAPSNPGPSAGPASPSPTPSPVLSSPPRKKRHR
ncbi:MAG TPA: PASTA domain-containing protein, partial [Jatrophihabitantaceae bacterium]|nr:PASTA domain-containing protein [Jatrophihabitantaceae bacterium]